MSSPVQIRSGLSGRFSLLKDWLLCIYLSLSRYSYVFDICWWSFSEWQGPGWNFRGWYWFCQLLCVPGRLPVVVPIDCQWPTLQVVWSTTCAPWASDSAPWVSQKCAWKIVVCHLEMVVLGWWMDPVQSPKEHPMFRCYAVIIAWAWEAPLLVDWEQWRSAIQYWLTGKYRTHTAHNANIDIHIGAYRVWLTHLLLWFIIIRSITTLPCVSTSRMGLGTHTYIVYICHIT